MRKLLLLLLVSLWVSFAGGLKDFFSRGGVVVDTFGGKVIIDLGKDKVAKGEKFTVVKGTKKLIHPITGKEIGVLEEEIALIEVKEVKDNFSIAKILSKKEEVKKGYRVKLSYENLCYEGSDEGLFKVSSELKEVRKGKEGCDYKIKELPDGFGVEFGSKPVAFFRTEESVVPKGGEVVHKAKEPDNFKVRAKMVMSFKEIPASADACDLYGNGRESLIILTSSQMKIYEVLRGTLVERGSHSLPAGYPVSVSCFRAKGTKGAYIAVSLITNGEANSVIYKMVGDTPVAVRDDIPFFINVLDKSRPYATLYGQEFNTEDLWGRVYKLRITGDEVVKDKEVKLPGDFRIDGAFMRGELLIYVNDDRTLKVYKGSELILSRDDFGGSYTQAQYPEMYEDLGQLSFNPKGAFIKLEGRFYPVIVRNKGSAIFKFLDVLKFKEAELYSLFNMDKKSPDLRMLKSDRLEEAVQALISLSDGRLIAITGRAGTIPMYNRGEVYYLTFEPLY